MDDGHLGLRFDGDYGTIVLDMEQSEADFADLPPGDKFISAGVLLTHWLPDGHRSAAVSLGFAATGQSIRYGNPATSNSGA